ncbi:MAG: maleylpyruvate isomerase family mycothiol-dependent enzyme [Nocardioidaceae bacterium]
MTESVWPTVHAERRALADDLADLSAEQWATQSLCGEWTVHQVLAHLLSTAKMTTPTFVARLGGARFAFHEYTARQVAKESAGGPAATLAAFRKVETRETAPPGPKETWLGEAFVHGEDIRRPLGIRRAYPSPQVVRAIGMYARSNLIIGGKTRVAGVTLKASDIDYSVGSGPLVEGPAISLLLVTSGRRSALDELSGPGVQTLRERS